MFNLTTSQKQILETVRDERRAWVVIAVIMCIGLFARLVCVTVLDILPVSDFASYLQMASNLYDDIGLRDNRHGSYAVYSGGYSLFMYLIFLFAGKNVETVQIFNAFLGLASILMVYSIAVDIARSRWVGALAALAWALYLPAILYAEYLAKENLMTLILLSQVRLMVAYPHCVRRTLVAVLFGILTGVQAVVGPAGLAIVPVFLIQMLWEGTDLRESTIAVVVVFAVALATVSPWLYRNYLLFGVPVLSTNNHNLYIGNNPNATGMFMSMANTPEFEGWQRARAQGELQASRYAGKAALEYIGENPGRTARLALKKAALFWWPPLHGSRGGDQSRAETLLRIVWAIQYFVLSGLAFASLFLLRFELSRAWILYASIACYTGMHMVFFVIFRYRLPIMPLICILAAWCVCEIWRCEATYRSSVETENQRE